MLTKNFKNLMAMILERTGSGAKGLMNVKSTTNTVFYLMGAYNTSAYPYAVAQGYTANMSSAGIALGSSNATASEDDYTLQSPITGGLSVIVTSTTGLDDGAPYLEYNLVVTNNGSSSVTIREVGYIQNLYTATAYEATSGGTRAFLLDRTVLGTAVTIAAGANGVIRYRLKTSVASAA